MPPIPVEADAPPDLVTPLTASAAASASQARRSSSDVDGTLGSSRSRSGKSRASSDGSARPTYLSSGATRGLAPPHQPAQSDIIAFRALGLLDATVTHLDALRHVAHRNRIGGVRARASR